MTETEKDLEYHSYYKLDSTCYYYLPSVNSADIALRSYIFANGARKLHYFVDRKVVDRSYYFNNDEIKTALAYIRAKEESKNNSGELCILYDL